MGYKVTIAGGNGFVRFEASIPVSETRTANYQGYDITHLPTDIWAYKNTSGRHFTIGGKLVSRNEGEAAANAGYLSTIRSWVLPGASAGGITINRNGATPPLVYLTAYNNRDIDNVQCIVRSYNWTFPDDVDFIFTDGEAMPVIGQISLELSEAYSPEQITNLEYYIPPGEGGSFTLTSGAAGQQGSTDVDFGLGSGFGGLASLVNGFQSVGNLLNTVAASVIPQLPTALGSIVSSPEVTEVTPQILEVSTNQFIQGSSIQQVINNSRIGPSGTVAVGTQPVVDSFNRTTNLPTPIFIDP